MVFRFVETTFHEVASFPAVACACSLLLDRDAGVSLLTADDIFLSFEAPDPGIFECFGSVFPVSATDS